MLTFPLPAIKGPINVCGLKVVGLQLKLVLYEETTVKVNQLLQSSGTQLETLERDISALHERGARSFPSVALKPSSADPMLTTPVQTSTPMKDSLLGMLGGLSRSAIILGRTAVQVR